MSMKLNLLIGRRALNLFISVAFIYAIFLFRLNSLRQDTYWKANSLEKERPTLEDRNTLCRKAVQQVGFLYNHSKKSLQRRGILFLYSKGVILAPWYVGGNTAIQVEPGNSVHLSLLQCGFCKDYEACHVSFHARIVGHDLIKSAEVYPSYSLKNQERNTGDYTIEFESPVVPGTYFLTVLVRWWHGLDDPGSKSQSYFLGGNGRLNFKNNNTFLEEEASCLLLNASVHVSVQSDEQDKNSNRNSHLCSAEDLNKPGYWENVDTRKLCSGEAKLQHESECWILDRANPSWLWRGNNCVFQFYSREQIRKCLRNTTIVAVGDSLPTEVYHNLIDFVPELKQSRVFHQNMLYKTLDFKTPWHYSTEKVYLITNFQVAHLIWHEPISIINSTIIPNIIKQWNLLTVNNSLDFHGIYYAGYPAHSERRPFITHERMVVANDLFGHVTRQIGWKVFDTTNPLWSRPDASWDGFHFLQVYDRIGGVSKMLTMMLLNYICSPNGKEFLKD